MKRKIRFLIIIATFSSSLLFSLQIYAGSRTKTHYQKITPEIILSKEGFRNVKWATRFKDITWKWSKSHFPADGFWQEKEDLNVFNVKAKWITYTFRNSIFFQ